jgi:hypothetical protein
MMILEETKSEYLIEPVFLPRILMKATISTPFFPPLD